MLLPAVCHTGSPLPLSTYTGMAPPSGELPAPAERRSPCPVPRRVLLSWLPPPGSSSFSRALVVCHVQPAARHPWHAPVVPLAQSPVQSYSQLPTRRCAHFIANNAARPSCASKKSGTYERECNIQEGPSESYCCFAGDRYWGRRWRQRKYCEGGMRRGQFKRLNSKLLSACRVALRLPGRGPTRSVPRCRRHRERLRGSKREGAGE